MRGRRTIDVHGRRTVCMQAFSVWTGGHSKVAWLVTAAILVDDASCACGLLHLRFPRVRARRLPCWRYGGSLGRLRGKVLRSNTGPSLGIPLRISCRRGLVAICWFLRRSRRWPFGSFAPESASGLSSSLLERIFGCRTARSKFPGIRPLVIDKPGVDIVGAAPGKAGWARRSRAECLVVDGKREAISRMLVSAMIQDCGV